MTQELIKEAEFILSDSFHNDDHEAYEGCSTCEIAYKKLAQKLTEALKEQQQAIDPRVLEKAIKGFKNRKAGHTYQMIYSKKVNAGQFTPEHSVEVSEDDDFYKIRKVERFLLLRQTKSL